jgi:hypothetical protein
MIRRWWIGHWKLLIVEEVCGQLVPLLRTVGLVFDLRIIAILLWRDCLVLMVGQTFCSHRQVVS